MSVASPAPNPFAARWTARGNNLCLGRWEISHAGHPLQLDPQAGQDDMGTYAIYSFFDPDDEMFAEGLHEDEWIVQKADWLTHLFEPHGIPASEENFRAFTGQSTRTTGDAEAVAGASSMVLSDCRSVRKDYPASS